jgi:hypothetical protein
MIVIAAISTVVIFLGSGMVFPPMETPPMSLLPAFMFLGFWDALAFGVGIALLIYLALNYSKGPKEIRGSLLVLFFIALWFSVLNWVHDGLHESGAAAPNFQLLAVTEYVFHFPWLIFALALVVVATRLSAVYTRHEVR